MKSIGLALLSFALLSCGEIIIQNPPSDRGDLPPNSPGPSQTIDGKSSCKMIELPPTKRTLEEQDASKFPKVGKEEFPEFPKPLDLKIPLRDKGLIGLIHGIDPESGLITYSYHVPGHFFKRFTLSLISSSEEVNRVFEGVSRGDRVYVKGFLSVKSGQPHVYVNEMALIKYWKPGVETPAGEYKRPLDAHCVLRQKKELTALVHAVGGDGSVLVLDYQDTVIPLVVRDISVLSKVEHLFRGDVVWVKTFEREKPGRPSHFEAYELKVVEDLVKQHDTEVTIRGRLTRFPKSPTINRDIWAVEYEIPGIGARYYTLVNFTLNEKGELEEFEKIARKMKAAWDEHPEGSFRGRNKFINKEVEIEVSGRFNLVSQSQANVQIFTKAEQILVD